MPPIVMTCLAMRSDHITRRDEALFRRIEFGSLPGCAFTTERSCQKGYNGQSSNPLGIDACQLQRFGCRLGIDRKGTFLDDQLLTFLAVNKSDELAAHWI